MTCQCLKIKVNLFAITDKRLFILLWHYGIWLPVILVPLAEI